jgi:hypothetical protein
MNVFSTELNGVPSHKVGNDGQRQTHDDPTNDQGNHDLGSERGEILSLVERIQPFPVVIHNDGRQPLPEIEGPAIRRERATHSVRHQVDRDRRKRIRDPDRRHGGRAVRIG